MAGTKSEDQFFPSVVEESSKSPPRLDTKKVEDAIRKAYQLIYLLKKATIDGGEP